MIKIIRGVFGYVDNDGAVIPKTVKDEPFEVSAEIEDRLIRQGVAVHIGNEEAPVKEENSETPAEEVVEEEVEVKTEAATQAKKPAGKKTNSKKKTSAKKDDDAEEPPVIEAVDPE